MFGKKPVPVEPPPPPPKPRKKFIRYADPVVNPDAARFEVNNWIVSDFVAKELIPIVGTEPFPLDELCLMVAAVTTFKPAQIFEWGTHIGKSARVFSETIQHFKIPGHIYSIDLPDTKKHVEHPGKQRGKLVRGRKNVTLIQGDGLKNSQKIADKPISGGKLFFLDGDHSYNSVKQEFETLLNKYPEAVFLLHDTFYQSKEANYNTGPYEAMQDVLKKQKGTYRVLSTQTGLPGMSLVYPAAH